MAYQNITGAGIGNLLRMIKEEKTNSPIVPANAQPGSLQRGAVQKPVYGPESPGTERVVSLQPEDVTAPVSPQAQTETAPSRVGPLAIGGEDVGAIVPPEPSIPGKGDINPETGKAYAVSPESGVWDDNYWANVVEPRLKVEAVFNQQQRADIPAKTDINPETGKPYAWNPETGVWDDNYFANIMEKKLLTGWRPGTIEQGGTGPFNQTQPQPQAESKPAGQVLGTQITGVGPDIGGLRANIQASDLETEALLNKNQQTLNRYENVMNMPSGATPTPLPKGVNPNAEEKRLMEEWRKKQGLTGKPASQIPTPTPTPSPIGTRIIGSSW